MEHRAFVVAPCIEWMHGDRRGTDEIGVTIQCGQGSTTAMVFYLYLSNGEENKASFHVRGQRRGDDDERTVVHTHHHHHIPILPVNSDIFFYLSPLGGFHGGMEDDSFL